MPGFGGEVKLTGEEAYRRSLTAITEALKENGAALKSVAEQYAKSDKSTTSVTSRAKRATIHPTKAKEYPGPVAPGLWPVCRNSRRTEGKAPSPSQRVQGRHQRA